MHYEYLKRLMLVELFLKTGLMVKLQVYDRFYTCLSGVDTLPRNDGQLSRLSSFNSFRDEGNHWDNE